MFADDTNLILSDEDIGELFQQMSKELKGSALSLQQVSYLDKIKCLFFIPLTKFQELFIDGITLEKETVTKFLGVVID